MANVLREKDATRPLREDFLIILVKDVIGAISRRDIEDSQANRRDLVRTVFVAVEGAVWDFRTEIIATAQSLDLLAPNEESALSEISYGVSEQGKIIAQQRFIPLLALIRLTARLANKINPEFQAGFDGNGWNDFRKAVKIRNRITHPKAKVDLILTSVEANACVAALDWLLDLHRSANEAILTTMRNHSQAVKEVVQGLIDGDPELLALYDSLSKHSDL